MVIHGTPLDRIGCKLWRYRITPSQYSGRSYWNYGSNHPAIVSGEYEWSNLEVDIYIEGESASEVERKKSLLNAMMMNPLIVLDEIDDKIEYVCAYENQVVIEKINEVASIATYNFKALKRGVMRTISLSPGNKEYNLLIDTQITSPCIYEITPLNDLETFTIDSISVQNLKANKKIVIDGIGKTVKMGEENKFSDTDFWEFPKLQPGLNLIKLSHSDVKVTIKFHPRYV